MQSDIGRQLGRFQIVALLGTGGFATVYRADDTELGRPVAIKILHPQLAVDAGFVQRFRAEARAAARVRHPNIVTVYEVGQTADGRPYLVMQLLEGSLLSEIVSSRGALRLDQVAGIVGQLASALDYLHAQRIIHRDLKPSNVMIAQDGLVTLMDFGIARSAEAETHFTRTGQMVGTPAYMAPEQISGGTISPATDIYSLGIVTYELLTGRPPFKGTLTSVIRDQVETPPPPITGLNPSILPAAANAVEQALAKDPARRPPAAGTFATLLAGNLPTQTYPLPPARRAQTLATEPPRRLWLGLGAAAVALVLVAAAAIFAFTRINPGASHAATVAPASEPTARATPPPSPSPSVSATGPASAATAEPVRPSPVATAAAAPDANTEQRVAQALRPLAASNGTASFIELSRNTEIGESAERQVPAASTVKLILAETVEQAVQQGRLRLDRQFRVQQSDVVGGTGVLQNQVGRTLTLHELLETTLVYSDNTGANMLIRALGGFTAINDEAKRVGLRQTSFSRFFGDLTPRGQGTDNFTSARDLAFLMKAIATNQGINQTGAEDLLAILRLRERQSPSIMSRGVPASTVQASIDGILPDLRAEVALLQLPGGRRGVLAVTVRDQPQAQAESMIAETAGRVVQAYSP